jgi:Flp pilus assembly protein TadD
MDGLSRRQIAKLQAAARAIRDGELRGAERLLSETLGESPEHPEALRLLGILYNRQERWTEALGVLKRAAVKRPDDPLVLSTLGTALTGAGEVEQALEAWRRAVALSPGDAMLWFNLGRNLQQAGITVEAVEALSRSLSLEPGALPTNVLLGDALVHLGRFDEARERYRAALQILPTCGDAWRGLSNMKTRPLEDAELAQLAQLATRTDVAPFDGIAMAFALGKALEDRGHPREAFTAISAANARCRALGAWDAAGFSRHVDAVMAASERFPGGSGQRGEEVIFVVSLPRSGSTLVEQILASHPLVEGASELTDLEWILETESLRRQRPFPEWLCDASEEDWARLGTQYLERTARWRRERPRHTDKMPDNWLYAGALRAMLPGAAIVDVRRDPVEVGWSCFKQQFYRVPHFSNALEDVAAYLKDHDRAVDAFAQAPGARIRVQRYEALVANPEAEVRALLDFCGLPFDAGCLAFHRSSRSVRTASAAQVRQPLRSDTAKAGRYEELLDPLRVALGLPRWAPGS